MTVAPAVADLTENALLWLAAPAALVRVASTAKWLLPGVALVVAVGVLLVGTARFLLPWSQPPRDDPDVPDGAVGPPKPCVEGQWFRSPDGDFPGVAYGIGLSGAGSGRRRSRRACCRRSRARRGCCRARSTSATVSGGGYVGVSSQALRHPLGRALDPDPYRGHGAGDRRIRRHARYLSHSWAGLGRPCSPPRPAG